MSDTTQVTQLLKQGIAAAKAGQKKEARQALIQVTELDERNEQAWLWLSGVVKSLEDRRICLQNVLDINPDNAHAQTGLRWLDQHAPPPPAAKDQCPHCQTPVPLSGTTCPNCQRPLIVACPACKQYVDVRDPACPDCGQELGDYREGASYYLTLARAYLTHGRYVQAQEAIAYAEAEKADDTRVLEVVAELHEEMGHIDQAIAVYEQAIEGAPENAALYVRLATLYGKRGRHDEAHEMRGEAVRRAVDAPEVLFEVAEMYFEEDDKLWEALKLLEHIVLLDPDHAQAHQLLGDAYLEQNRLKEAIKHLERACELASPDSPLGKEARRKLERLRPSLPDHQVQGWGETCRLMGGLMLVPALAALVNARLIPWKIRLAAWIALLMAGTGAFLWVCATNVPRNPFMRRVFGPEGVKGLGRQVVVGLPGVLLWLVALTLIMIMV
jgi:tetratricopeptide (TPR) repeat protein